MEEGILVRGKRDPKTLLLKLGFAIVVSIAGYLSSQLLSRPRLPPPPSSGSKKSGSKSSGIGLKDELLILTREEELAKIVNVNGTHNHNSTNISKVIDPGFEAYPEGKKPLAAKNEEMEREKLEMEAYPESKIPLEWKNKEMEWQKEKLEMEEEIGYLRNLVEALKERERTLEMQLIEFYGLKEQEATLRELENRVKVNATESKMLHLKIDSLQADKQKLQSQVSDYTRAVAELESAREEIKVLKGKLKLEGEEAKQKLASLHERITMLQDRILEDREIDAEVEEKLRRVKELEDEVADLHEENLRLTEDNLKLACELESTKMAASSDLKSQEVEASHVREENEKLKKEIEQLQTDRCTDVEELVYLRWVNACLRYELRNYQPAPGTTVARDLGKSLSPKSEEKAKQLILQYAHSGINDKSMNHFDFDTQSCSSRASSEECTDTSIDYSSSSKNSRISKSKFLGKLKKLVLGKDSQNGKDKAHGRPTKYVSSSRRASVSPCSPEELNERRSFDSISSCISVENATANHLTGMDLHVSEQWINNTAESQRACRLSLDIERLRKLDVGIGKDNVEERCKSDIGRAHGYMRMISEDDSLNDPFDSKNHEDSDVPEKVKLKKFADVLKGSQK